MFSYFYSGIITLGSILVLNKLFNWFKISRKIKKKLNDVNTRKLGLFQKFQGMKIPLDNIEKLCNLTGEDIHKKIKSSEFSPVDVLEAFQANAIIKNNEFNFLSDVIYEADVSSLLINIETDSETMGLPLAISDSLSVEKYDCTFGLVKETFNPSEKDCIIIKVLKENGAIPSIITNTSQGDLFSSTGNPLFGKTLNCVNVKKTCGGGAGGVAVALVTSSAVLGVASDIQGNIRIPSSYCGVFGLKTTSNRISSRYVKNPGLRQNIIKDSIGPMANNINDLIALFKAMVCQRMFDYDGQCCPIPFNDTLFSSTKPLKIGYFVHLGGKHASPIPAVERAISLARVALERAGHELVEFNLPDTDHIINDTYWKILFSDGGQSISKMLHNEPADLSVKLLQFFICLPRCLKRFIGALMGLVCKSGGKYLSAMAGVESIHDYWKLQDIVDKFREQVLDSWQNENIDGLICPVLPVVAPSVSRFNFIASGNAYSLIYNIIDYVAGSVPVTKVISQDIDKLNNSYAKKSKLCRKVAKSQKDSLGMPVGVQCVALPWREEVALRIMKNLTDNL